MRSVDHTAHLTSLQEVNEGGNTYLWIKFFIISPKLGGGMRSSASPRCFTFGAILNQAPCSNYIRTFTTNQSLYMVINSKLCSFFAWEQKMSQGFLSLFWPTMGGWCAGMSSGLVCISWVDFWTCTVLWSHLAHIKFDLIWTIGCREYFQTWVLLQINVIVLENTSKCWQQDNFQSVKVIWGEKYIVNPVLSCI